MRVGIILPQGWTGEYAGLDARAAWTRSLEVARAAEELGFESIWLFDHFHTTPEPTDEITFESLTALSALAASTRRVRLGQIVACAAYRNPALLAKMISTLDAISGGRIEVGLGAGWKRDEFDAYGYPFLAPRARLDVLRDTLEVVTRMFAPGRATWTGEHAGITGAINVPKPIQRPRPPIMVGGNGREVTWRLAARHADELNLDAVPPDELPDAMRVIADRCHEVGRDPATLRVSVHIWWEHLDAAPDRSRLLEAYRLAGVDRVMTLVRETARDPAALESFRDDAVEAGADLERGPEPSLDPRPTVATRL
jgi:F420-dependent oxidoreductase-like protein